MVVKDWMTELADAIQDRGGIDSSREAARPWVRAIIEEFSPFKEGVAYMEVPRCGTCAHWASISGACTFIQVSAPKAVRGALLLLTTADFGCTAYKPRNP